MISTFRLCWNAIREKLATSIQFTEATRLAADAWRNVDEETKKKYVDKAAVLREKYQKEKEEYRHKREQESKESAQRQLVRRQTEFVLRASLLTWVSGT